MATEEHDDFAVEIGRQIASRLSLAARQRGWTQGAAERERRRIRRRVIRSYEGRRERGATTHNKVPFGVQKVGDRLVPSDDAWAIREFDRLVLSGVGLHEAGRAIRALGCTAWNSDSSLKRILVNPAFLEAGLRTQEQHDALLAIGATLSARFGVQVRRVHDHEFTGVFRCAQCGYRLHSVVRQKPFREVLVCNRQEQHVNPKSESFHVNENLRAQWFALVSQLEDDVDAWAANDVEKSETRRALERQIAALDQRAADLKRRRDRAFDLLVDGDATIEAQARKLLREINGDEQALEMQRSIVEAEIAAQPAVPRRSADGLRAVLATYRELYDGADLRVRNDMNRTLCEVVGSYPVIARGRKRNDKTIVWDALRVVV